MHAHLRMNIYVIGYPRMTALGVSAPIRKDGTTNVNHSSFNEYLPNDVNYCKLVSFLSTNLGHIRPL